jgi:hypothetical protein
LFSISGIAFALRVAPLQKKILQLLLNQDSSNDFDWMNFKDAYIILPIFDTKRLSC